MRLSLLLLVPAVCAACAASAPPVHEVSHADASRPAPSQEPRPDVVVDASLRGPYSDAELTAFAQPLEDQQPARYVVRGELPHAGFVVRLVELPEGPASSTCVVAIETRAGHYLGQGFLCSANRSDELVLTELGVIDVADGRVTIQFRTSYVQQDDLWRMSAPPPADFRPYAITCDVSSTLSCSSPPAIGGYDVNFVDESFDAGATLGP